MNGATEFTRKAGLAGLLSYPFALLVLGGARYSAPDNALVGLLAFVVLIAALVSLAGLIVRHRMCRWMRTVVFLGAFAIALAFTVGASLLVYGLAAALGVLFLGILVEGFLPRAGAALVLLSFPAEMAVSALAGDALSIPGFVLLYWAMWREPQPGAARRGEAAAA